MRRYTENTPLGNTTQRLQCVSPVSRAFSLVAFEDIICDMFEPRVRTT